TGHADHRVDGHARHPQVQLIVINVPWMDLSELVDPRHTTIVCMEMERGVVGDLCLVPGLEDAVRESGIVERCRSLFTAARQAGIRVVHCTAAFRPDRTGSYRNIPSVNRFLENPDH